MPSAERKKESGCRKRGLGTGQAVKEGKTVKSTQKTKRIPVRIIENKVHRTTPHGDGREKGTGVYQDHNIILGGKNHKDQFHEGGKNSPFHDGISGHFFAQGEKGCFRAKRKS